MKKLLLNCFWLVLPALIWSTVFVAQLPAAYQSEVFWNDIPAGIAIPENVLRVVALLIPIFLRLSIRTQRQRLGMVLYGLGLLAYFASWVPLMVAPDTAWSRSIIGFIAPALTPVLWLMGIVLIGEPIWPFPYRSWVYALVVLSFVGFHASHALFVHGRIHRTGELALLLVGTPRCRTAEGLPRCGLGYDRFPADDAPGVHRAACVRLRGAGRASRLGHCGMALPEGAAKLQRVIAAKN